MKSSAKVCLVLLLTCLVRVRVRAQDEADESKTDWSCLAGYAAVGIVGGTATLVAAPFALGAVGFTAGGVTAGSFAAGVQSIVYGGAATGAFSVFQSAGAAGLGAAAKTAVFSTGAAAAAYVKDKLAPCAEGPKCSKD